MRTAYRTEYGPPEVLNLTCYWRPSLLGGKSVSFPIPLDPKRSLTLIKRLVEQGEFRPVIDRLFPLDQIQEAFRYVESGQKIGNLILTLD